MSPTKVASISVLVCVLMASAVHADSRQDRERRRGRDARVAVDRRAVVRSPVVARRGGARPVVRPVVRVAPFRPQLGYRPMYRPGLGVGIYIGSPYRYRYPTYSRRSYAAPYPSPYAYGYPSPAYTTDIYAGLPQDALYGGVRLDVTPRDAAVYVDGYYAGIVDDFDGALQRVALEPGPHHFEIEAPGLETLAFDVNVRPNQTVRYRGDMLRLCRSWPRAGFRLWALDFGPVA